jgi:hypothetical protein
MSAAAVCEVPTLGVNPAIEQACRELLNGCSVEPPKRTWGFSRAGDLVADPFCGSASTCAAALLVGRVGRRFLGIELDKEYHRNGSHSSS